MLPPHSPLPLPQTEEAGRVARWLTTSTRLLSGSEATLDWKAWVYKDEVCSVFWDIAPVFTSLGYSASISVDRRLRSALPDLDSWWQRFGVIKADHYRQSTTSCERASR